MEITANATRTSEGLPNERIYIATAAIFLIVVIVGFAPNSVAIIEGSRPTPPLVVHVHAVLMVAWLVLLMTQTSLRALGDLHMHKRLGVGAFLLAPALWLALIAVTYTIYRSGTEAGFGDIYANFLLVQIRSIVLFPTFFWWAIRTRRSAPDTHKRMMLLATLVLIDAALGRMAWLPGTNVPESYDMVHAYQLLLIAPAILHDLLGNGKVHRAYVVGMLFFLPWIIATSLLWNSEWWLQTVPRIMGTDGFS